MQATARRTATRPGTRPGRLPYSIRPLCATPGNGPSGINVQGHRPTSPKGWEAIVKTLKTANVKVIAPQELTWAQDKGVVVIDVRPEGDYEKGHVPRASSVPYYQPIQGWTPWQVVRRVGFTLFGVLNGTEVNPNFVQEVGAVAPAKDTPVVVYCSLGGTLESLLGEVGKVPDVDTPASDSGQDAEGGPGGAGGKKKGMQTRSVVAAYALVTEGYTNVQVLKGGYSAWVSGGRDIEVFEDSSEQVAA